ncbi:hypothetical protein GCM10007391_34030 [Alteromonas halophila]|uniref:PDZ domain-containing protein n=1 Tax=Alteromonas halophila TaxID=516698 RepID=A0A918N1B0_9ALTE|nr:hypothetical protein GCM10007391_34030 [Alteromonas halophila]
MNPRVQSNHKTRIPILADRSGLRLLPHNEGAIVKDVAVGTGAESLTISKNSIVTSIDGIKINSGNFDQVTSMLSNRNVDSVTVCWIGPENQTCKELVLNSRI